jgi:hypothetical protein
LQGLWQQGVVALYSYLFLFWSEVVGRDICQPLLQNVSAMLQELREAHHVLRQVPAAVYQRRL